MQYKPYKYQTYAEQFVIEHESAGLLLDVGLGKTAIVLHALWQLILDFFDIGRVLVVAPIRVAKDTWPKEIEKWDDIKGLSYSVVVGTAKERRAALMKPAFLYIANREVVSWIVDNDLFNFDCLVIDELSSFKAYSAKRFKSLKKVRGSCKRIIGMTGTPGDLLSLWSQIYLLDGGVRLERFITAYRNKYFLPDKRNRDVIFSYKPKEGAEDAIYKKISDICISMKANDYLELPDKVISNVEVEMDEKEREMYDQLKKDLVLPLEGGDIDAQSAVGLSNKLLQMASGQVYDENGTTRVVHEKKLEVLEDLIEAANGKPVLIAYWFRSSREELIKRFGAVPIDTPEDIKRWNNNEIPVAIIHPQSAGHGLNLQEGGACHLIWFTLPWSLELYEQCNGRLYRNGQTNTVTIQHVITKGTIDEDVLSALEKKDCTQEALIDAVKARIK